MVGTKRKSSGSAGDAGSPAAKTAFEVGQQVLAFDYGKLYVAKVINTKTNSEGIIEYRLHYNGWKKKWDSWLKEENIHPDNEESRALQARLDSVVFVQDPGQSKHVSKKGGDAFSDDPNDDLIRLIIPHTLQKQLIDDHARIKEGRLYNLPRKPVAAAILEQFLAAKREEEQGNACEDAILTEMVQGLKTYFDSGLGMILLYPEEYSQYETARMARPGVPPCEIYGIEHLLRLVVKLPMLLENANMHPDSALHLHPRLLELLRFFERNASSFFLCE